MSEFADMVSASDTTNAPATVSHCVVQPRASCGFYEPCGRRAGGKQMRDELLTAPIRV